MRKIAIYDLGSNAFKILIAEVQSNNFNILFKSEEPVKLASKGINNKHITNQAIQRAFKALEKFNQTSEKFKVDKIICIGTSALRDAFNSKEILNDIKDKFNLKVTIIDGQKEAELIYNGVKCAYDFTNEKALIMDIGGGSIEIIITDNHNIYFQHSFDIGVRRVFEKLEITDPITPNQIEKIETYYEKELRLLDIQLAKFNINTLIGTSGSFQTINNLICNNFNIDQKQVGKASLNIPLSIFNKLCDIIILLPAYKREKIKGMDINRIDLISMTLVFVKYFIKKYKFVNIVYSKYSLKEGILYKTIL